MKLSLRLWALFGLWLSLLAAGPLQAQTGTTIPGTLVSGGRTREYLLYVPKSYQPGKSVPLVVHSHGQSMTSLQQEGQNNFPQVADTANFLIVYPQALKDLEDPKQFFKQQTCWNAFWVANRADDAGFIADLITKVQAQYSIDAQRVYAVGLSNGGYMSHLLGAQLSSRIAAIGSVSGGLGDGRIMDPPPSRPVPVLEIHGDADPIVDYSGIPPLMARWVQRNGCAPTPALVKTLPHYPSRGTTTVERSVWSRSPGDSTVVLYTIHGGNHDWPFSAWRDIDGATEIWRFLRKFRLPTPPSPAPGANLALNKPVSSSALEYSWLASSAAVDGQATTRWSTATDQQWLVVDLGASYNVNEVKLTWAAAYGIDYTLDVSPDATTWTTLKSVTGNSVHDQVLDYSGLSGSGRYVRVNSQPLASAWGCSIYELEVYGTPASNIVAGGVYELEPQNALGQRLDVYSRNTSDGATVALFARNGGTNQQWKFIDRGNGVYELEPQHALGKRLDVLGLSTADNATVSTWSSNGGPNQQWKATALGGDIYELEPQQALGKRLDTSVSNGIAQAVSTTRTGGSGQRWKLYTVASTPATAAKVLAQSADAAAVLSVFPNPVTATASVTLSGVAAYPATAEVYDGQGTRLSSTPLTQASDGLDVTKLATGLYTLRVSSAQTVQTVRLQKN